MSFGDLTSGNAFYSEPNPAAIGSPVLKETGDLDRSRELPLHATPPAYARYQDSGADSFAPSSMTSDQSFQPQIPQPVQQPSVNLPLIAAGLFVLFLVFKGDK